jgi:hypothetical protein
MTPSFDSLLGLRAWVFLKLKSNACFVIALPVILVLQSPDSLCIRQCSAAGPLAGIRTVALLSDSYPGLPIDVRLEQFGRPNVDATGRTAFKARLLQGIGGTSAVDDTAIWTEIAIGNLQYVARENNPVPGWDYRFQEPEPGEEMMTSASGNSYFVAGIISNASPITISSGMFRHAPTTGTDMLAASSPIGPGIPTAGGPGTGFTNFRDINEAGSVVMQTGSGFGPILALPPGGALTTITTAGSFPKVNFRGDVVFRDTTIPTVNRLLVWNSNQPTPRTIAVEDAVAPGMGGAVFNIIGREGTFENANGTVTFLGNVSGTGITTANDVGIWSESSPGGAIQLRLREGGAAIGLGPGIVWSGFSASSSPRLTFGRNGGVAAHFGLSGTGVNSSNDIGVWAGRDISNLHLVAREGDPAPGTELGTFFRDISEAGVTPDGRAVFTAYLDGSGRDPNQDLGLWAEAANGSLQLLARIGDLVQLPSGVTSPLTSIQLNVKTGIGENGHVAFIGGFPGGQFGIFVSDAVAVPEPTAFTLGILFLVINVSHRRRSAS